MRSALHETHGTATEHDKPWRCELRIKGHLDDRWADWFEGLSFTYESNGTTISLARWSIRPHYVAC